MRTSANGKTPKFFANPHHEGANVKALFAQADLAWTTECAAACNKYQKFSTSLAIFTEE
jgi:hypothetical protein